MGRSARIALAAAFLLGASACGGGAAKPEPLGRWLAYDASARTVTVTALAGYQGINGGRNFNGYFRGAVLVSSPHGWRVTVKCINLGSVRHSCAIVSDSLATRPAFSQSATRAPTVGLPPGHSAAFSFRPKRLGSYRLASLVGGDELMGMWDSFEVTRSLRPQVTLLRTYGR